jgi:hypothetical protein
MHARKFERLPNMYAVYSLRLFYLCGQERKRVAQCANRAGFCGYLPVAVLSKTLEMCGIWSHMRHYSPQNGKFAASGQND